MASSTTNLGLRKPARTDDWDVDTDFNANMEKLDEFAGEMQNKLVISAASINALKNALDSALAAMPNSGVKAFQVNFTSVESPFTQASYLCTLYKSASNVTYADATFRRIDQPIVIDGARNTNGWSFNSITSRITQKNVNVGSYAQTTANAWENTGITIVVPSGHLYIGMLTSGYSSGRPLGIAVDRSANPSGDMMEQSAESANGQYSVSVFLYPGTWYIFTKRASVATSANNYYFRYVDMYA